MKRKGVFLLLALAVALALTSNIEPGWAYFTSNARARGALTVSLGATHLEEDFYNWTKHVTVVSDPGSQASYIRARAFAGEEYELVYSGEGWTPGGDGWYYYDEIVYGGEATDELLVQIRNVPEDAGPGDGFNVVVVYESTPVRYDADGNPYADWHTEGGGGQ